MQEFFKKIDKKYIIKKLQPKKSGSSEGPQKTSLKSISSIISLEEQKQKKSSLYSEKHYLVDEIRNYFGETAKKGKGSFPFYLGFFKRIPKATIYQYWSEVKESRKPIKDQQKLFWWKIGKHVRESKTKK